MACAIIAVMLCILLSFKAIEEANKNMAVNRYSIKESSTRVFTDSYRARIRTFVHFAKELAAGSKCKQRGTAALCTNSRLDQIYSIGINGGPSGGIDCLCALGGKYTCVHAEAQCIAKCTSTDTYKTLICTLSPCVTCAALIVNSGYSQVIYVEQWKDPTGIQILLDAGIGVFQYEEE